MPAQTAPSAKIELTLKSATNSAQLSKLDGTKIYTEDIPAILEAEAKALLPSPITFAATAYVKVEGNTLSAGVTISDDLPEHLKEAFPTSYQLFSAPVGLIGQLLAQTAHLTDVEETVSVELAFVAASA